MSELSKSEKVAVVKELHKILCKKQPKIYTLKACENLMQKFVDLGGEVLTVKEGCLGLGTTICFAEGKKTAVIQEVFLNAWSCGHTIRMYNKLPKKYEKMIEYFENDCILYWYEDNYPDDDLGAEISEDAKFSEVEYNLGSVYEYLGVHDSVVRERVFEEVSKRNNQEYSVIYNNWLNAAK
jgi:hypothetical protein